jgi:hypothetical protein
MPIHLIQYLTLIEMSGLILSFEPILGEALSVRCSGFLDFHNFTLQQINITKLVEYKLH